MFYIQLPTNFLQANGKPFKKVKLDSNDRPAREVIKPTCDKCGHGDEIIATVTATYSDMLEAFLNNLFGLVAKKAEKDKDLKPLQMSDSATIVDIFRALHVAKEVMELEKAPYEWLQSMLTKYGTDIFEANAAVMLEPLKIAKETAPTRAEKRRGA